MDSPWSQQCSDADADGLLQVLQIIEKCQNGDGLLQIPKILENSWYDYCDAKVLWQVLYILQKYKHEVQACPGNGHGLLQLLNSLQKLMGS